MAFPDYWIVAETNWRKENLAFLRCDKPTDRHINDLESATKWFKTVTEDFLVHIGAALVAVGALLLRDKVKCLKTVIAQYKGGKNSNCYYQRVREKAEVYMLHFYQWPVELLNMRNNLLYERLKSINSYVGHLNCEFWRQEKDLAWYRAANTKAGLTP
jgi:hypothetical protein